MSTNPRLVPEIPRQGEPVKLLIDTDAANEIDDLYAVSLALATPERFEIIGFVATHFAASSGPKSIDQSYDVLQELFAVAGMSGRFPLHRGSHPMRYPRTPERSAGVDFIIESAKRQTPSDPLWIVVLGAATNIASALLLAPEISPSIRVLFHGRSEDTWPTCTRQFNVYGDIIAVQTILSSNAPLAWFDTGTRLFADMQTTAGQLAPLGALGRYLHEYRFRSDYFKKADKGFFDLGDIAWLIDPSLCIATTIDAPELTRWMDFRQTDRFGQILHVGGIDPVRTWELFYRQMRRGYAAGGAFAGSLDRSQNVYP